MAHGVSLLLHLEDFLPEEHPAFLVPSAFQTDSEGTLSTSILSSSACLLEVRGSGFYQHGSAVLCPHLPFGCTSCGLSAPQYFTLFWLGAC